MKKLFFILIFTLISWDRAVSLCNPVSDSMVLVEFFDSTLFSKKITLQIQTAAACTLVTNTADAGPGSLREAINCANSNPGPDTIRFEIPGAGPHVIFPQILLPYFSDDGTVLDGSTQPAGDIVIDGSNASITSGQGLIWVVDNSGFEMYDLILKNSTAPGLRLQYCQNFKVGAPSKGITAYANCKNCTGGDGTEAIVFNSENGSVQASRFGINENNTKPAQNTNFALTFSGKNILVGGRRSLGEGNLFGNATTHSLGTWGDTFTPIISTSNLIFGNNIGTGATGTEFFGSHENGIDVGFTGGTLMIGDSDPDHLNIIKNHKKGVQTWGATSITDLLGNQVSCNSVAGTGFGAGAIEPAVPIFSVQNNLLSGKTLPDARIDIYRHDPNTCPNSPCQGAFYLGSANADAAGNWSFLGNFTAAESYTATTTGSDGRTSAFSPCQFLCSTTVRTTADAAPGSLREAINCANSNPGPDTIRFEIPGAGPHVIALQTGLPTNTDDGTVIDGSTQIFGKIIVDAAAAPSGEIIFAQSVAGFEVYGLILKNSTGSGIALENCSGFKIGATGKGNIVYGSGRLDAPFPYDFANFGDNYNADVFIFNCSGGSMQANQIGMTESLGKPARPTAFGIAVSGQNILVGGNRSAGEGNAIGNVHFGVSAWQIPGFPKTTGIQLFGNNIGTDFGGTADFGNVSGSDFFNDIADIRIGNGPDQANLYRFNEQAIGVSGPGFGNARVRFNQNAFFCNQGGPLIKTAPAHPLAIQTATTANISGTASPNDLIEIYRSDNSGCVGMANCQGSVFLGPAQADGTGKWSFSGNFLIGKNYTASATSLADGWTAGFCACKTAVNCGIVFNLSKTLCPGETETVDGQVFSQTKPAGQVVLQAANGCDSTINVSLFFKNAPVFNLSKTLCPGETETVGGQVFSQTKPAGQVVLQAANGCDSTIYVDLKFFTAIQISNKTETCDPDNSKYTVAFSISGGTPGYFLNGQSVGSSFSSAPILSGENYIFKIKDSKNCPAPDVFGQKNCNNNQIPTVVATAVNLKTCAGDTLGLIENGTGGAAWNWSGPGGWVSGQRNPIRQNATVAMSGKYFVTVTSATGGKAIASVEIQVFEKTTAKLELQDDRWQMPFGETLAHGNLTENDGLPAGISPKIRVVAPPRAGSVLMDSLGNAAYNLLQSGFSGVDSVRYEICENGCQNRCDTAWLLISVASESVEDLKKYFTNFISPNDDGRNETFDPMKILNDHGYFPDLDRSELTIFDRTGQAIFRSKKPYRAWGFPETQVPTGTYYYLLQVDVGPVAQVLGPITVVFE